MIDLSRRWFLRASIVTATGLVALRQPLLSWRRTDSPYCRLWLLTDDGAKIPFDIEATHHDGERDTIRLDATTDITIVGWHAEHACGAEPTMLSFAPVRMQDGDCMAVTVTWRLPAREWSL